MFYRMLKWNVLCAAQEAHVVCAAAAAAADAAKKKSPRGPPPGYTPGKHGIPGRYPLPSRNCFPLRLDSRAPHTIGSRSVYVCPCPSREWP
eukprot:5276561-Pyramimonas_sp.AAC.1